MLDVTVSLTDGVLTATILAQTVGAEKAAVIHNEVCDAIDKAAPGLRAFVLDLSGVTFMNSMGVGMCIDVRNRAHERGARVVLLGANPELRKLFEVVNIARLFIMAKDGRELEGALTG